MKNFSRSSFLEFCLNMTIVCEFTTFSRFSTFLQQSALLTGAKIFGFLVSLSRGDNSVVQLFRPFFGFLQPIQAFGLILKGFCHKILRFATGAKSDAKVA